MGKGRNVLQKKIVAEEERGSSLSWAREMGGKGKERKRRGCPCTKGCAAPFKQLKRVWIIGSRRQGGYWQKKGKNTDSHNLRQKNKGRVWGVWGGEGKMVIKEKKCKKVGNEAQGGGLSTEKGRGSKNCTGKWRRKGERKWGCKIGACGGRDEEDKELKAPGGGGRKEWFTALKMVWRVQEPANRGKGHVD